MAVDMGYEAHGDKSPYIASYFINTEDGGNMFRRVKNGYAYNVNTKGSPAGNFFYIFLAPSTYFHVVGKRVSDPNPFISRVCRGDEGDESKKYDSFRYRSYIDIQYR